MLKNDIKKSVLSRNNMNPNNKADEAVLLTGQTISENEIKSFSSYKLMNPEEREIVDLILNSMEKKDSGNSNDKALRKRIDSLVPRSNEANVADFLDTT